MTWSKHRRLDLFWPLEWLPKDEDLKRARIFTFGYNAKFKSSAQSSSIGIADFSKNLLFDMRFGRDDYSGSFNLGKVWVLCRTKLILVDRRLYAGTNYFRGALYGWACLQKGWSVSVWLLFQWLSFDARQAFLDAQLDGQYASIISAVKTVIFLSTPHRGSDLAPYLNRVLSLAVGSSSKQYIAELTAQAPFLLTINEQFRHVANDLQIFSFYESLQSSIGLSSAVNKALCLIAVHMLIH
jgi:hypothetical protein